MSMPKLLDFEEALRNGLFYEMPVVTNYLHFTSASEIHRSDDQNMDAENSIVSSVPTENITSSNINCNQILHIEPNEYPTISDANLSESSIMSIQVENHTTDSNSLGFIETATNSPLDNCHELQTLTNVNGSELSIHDGLIANVKTKKNGCANKLLFRDYFRIIKLKKDKRENIVTECLLCKKTTGGSLKATSNFIRHLRRNHFDNYCVYEQEKESFKMARTAHQAKTNVPNNGKYDSSGSATLKPKKNVINKLQKKIPYRYKWKENRKLMRIAIKYRKRVFKRKFKELQAKTRTTLELQMKCIKTLQRGILDATTLLQETFNHVFENIRQSVDFTTE